MNDQYLVKIRHLMCSVLIVDDLSVDEDLFASGYLDSLGIVNLIIALEEEFQIALPMEDLNLEQFQSVESICKHITPLIDSTAVK